MNIVTYLTDLKRKETSLCFMKCIENAKTKTWAILIQALCKTNCET